MPTKKAVEKTEDGVTDDVTPSESSIPVDGNSVMEVYLETSVEWDYGVVKKTFVKGGWYSPSTMLDQERVYNALEKQIDFHHQEWAKNTLPKLRRYGRPIDGK